MEKRLRELFDYQHFAKNKLLDDVIKETGEPGGRVLSDDDMAMVNAAGEPEAHRSKKGLIDEDE